MQNTFTLDGHWAGSHGKASKITQPAVYVAKQRFCLCESIVRSRVWRPLATSKLKTEEIPSNNFYLYVLAPCDPTRRERQTQKRRILHYAVWEADLVLLSQSQLQRVGRGMWGWAWGTKFFLCAQTILECTKTAQSWLFHPPALLLFEIFHFFVLVILWLFFFGVLGFSLEFCHHGFQNRLKTSIFDENR